MKMKKIIKITFITLFGILTTKCTSIRSVGSLNMVATRNMETTAKYVEIQKFTELTKKEKKQSRAETIQAAVDDVVKKVQGGEYLMNARIYLIRHDNFFAYSYFYAVDGDVWGKKIK
jgi:hypothetical protein